MGPLLNSIAPCVYENELCPWEFQKVMKHGPKESTRGRQSTEGVTVKLRWGCLVSNDSNVSLGL